MSHHELFLTFLFWMVSPLGFDFCCSFKGKLPMDAQWAQVVMLTVSAVPSITLAFLFGKWQSSRQVLAVLSDEEGGWCGPFGKTRRPGHQSAGTD